MTVTFGNLTQNIFNFVVSNSVAIITIIITIIGIIGTPYYLRSRVNSAQQERYNQAKNILLDVLENHVMNGREISRARINTLQSAIERRYSVSISDRVSTSELLEDLLLRIEESKLDIDDKESYTGKIEEKINNFQEERRFEDLPNEYQLAIENLGAQDDISPETIIMELEDAREKRQQKSYGGPFDMMKLILRPDEMNNLPPHIRRSFMVAILIYISIIYLALVLL